MSQITIPREYDERIESIFRHRFGAALKGITVDGSQVDVILAESTGGRIPTHIVEDVYDLVGISAVKGVTTLHFWRRSA